MFDYENLHNINPDWLIIIVLFIQHKNMDATKLARIMNMSASEAEKEIYYLSNAGVLEVREKDIYSLNRYIEPFLINTCNDKGII